MVSIVDLMLGLAWSLGRALVLDFEHGAGYEMHNNHIMAFRNEVWWSQ